MSTERPSPEQERRSTRIPDLGPRGEGWVALQFVLFAAIFLAPFVAGGAWSQEARSITTLAGGLLGIAGLALAALGLVELRSSLTALPHPRDGAELVETGVYAHVRHPIYGGLVIGATGWSLLTASPAALLMTAVLLAFFRLKSGREEAWLRERYVGYEAYAARTRRIIPYVY
jgi:protein-S-isoprenylcysteine O-methyltransferase Ste14